MDKSVLLVLMCLQAFLLITAFSSTDAVALVKYDRQPKPLDPKRFGEKIPSFRFRGSCRRRPGGCRGRPRPRPTENIILQLQETKTA